MEQLNLKEPVEELKLTPEFGYTPAQKARDFQLQEEAGVQLTEDFEGVRSQLAQLHREDEEGDMYAAAGNILASQQGEGEAQGVSDFVKNYQILHSYRDITSSLEEEAAINQIEDSFATNDNTRINNDNLKFVSDLEDGMTKANILQTKLEELREYADNGSQWKRLKDAVPDWLGRLVAGQAMWDVLKQPTVEDLLVDVATPVAVQAALASGQTEESKKAPKISYVAVREAQEKEIAEKAATLTSEEFSEYLDGVVSSVKQFHPTYIKNFVNDLESGVDKSMDLFGALELSGAAEMLFKFGGKSAAKVAKATGNNVKATQIVKQAVEDGKDKVTILEDAVTSTATQPFQNNPYRAMSNQIKDQLADTLADPEAMEIISKYREAGELTGEELTVAKEIVKEDVKSMLKGTSTDLLDTMAIDIERTETGAYNAKVLIGTGMDGKAAMDVAAVQNMARRMGLQPGEWNVANVDGSGLYLQVVKPLSEHQLTRIGAEGDDISDFSAMGLQRYFAGSTKQSVKAHQYATASERLESGMRTEMLKEAAAVLKPLSKDEKKMVASIFENMQKANEGYGRWLTEEEVESLPDKVARAYKTFKKHSDIDYIAHNDIVYNRLSGEGWKLIDNKVAKEVPLKAITRKDFDKIIVDGADTYDEFKTKLSDGTHKLIAINRRSILDSDLNYTHKLVSSSTFDPQPLPRFITNYAAGGRRAYTQGTAMVKVGNTFEKAGKIFNSFPRTLRAGTNSLHLKQYADEVNHAIETAKMVQDGLIDPVRAQQLITKANYKFLNVRNWDDLKSLVKSSDNTDGILDLRSRAQVLEDGQKYIYDNGFENFADTVENLDDSLQELIDVRAEFGRRRGRILDGINGGEAKLASIDKIWEDTITRASYNNAMSDLNRWYERQFAENFQKFVENGSTMKPSQLINGKLMPFEQVPTELRKEYRAALAMQQRYERLRNTPTAYDKYMDRVLKTCARKLDNIPFVGRNLKRFIESAEPAAAARALHFNYTMGWFNSAQFWKQALGIVNTAGIHPIRTAQGVLAYIPIRLGYYAQESGKTGVLKHLAEFFTRATGVSKQDYYDFLQYMNKAASTHSMGLRQEMSARHARSVAYNNLKRFQYIGFEEGTNANLIVSDFVAFMENKGKSFREIAAYADDMYLNMTRASESAFQHGDVVPTQLLAQWTTYPLRLIEAMGNKRLTKTQRLGILASNMLMFGTAGTLGTKMSEVNAYRFLKDEAGIPGEIAGAITTGIFREALKTAGYDVDEGLSLGEWIGKELSFFDTDGEDFMISNLIPSSSAYGHVASSLYVISKLINPDTNNFDIVDFAQMVSRERGLPTGMRKAAQAYLAAETHKITNTKGKIVKENTNIKDALAVLTGFTPAESTFSTYIYEMIKDETTFMNNCYEDYVKPYQDAYNSYNNDIEGRLDDPKKAQEELDRRKEAMNKAYAAALQMLQNRNVGDRIIKDFKKKVIEGYRAERVEVTSEKAGYKYNPNLMRSVKEQVLKINKGEQ